MDFGGGCGWRSKIARVLPIAEGGGQVGVVAVWWMAPPPGSRLEAMRVGAHEAGLVIEIEMSEGGRGKPTDA
jgi:hypothetical protein